MELKYIQRYRMQFIWRFMDKIKALSLLSGGLDSFVATKMILEQGIDVVCVNFKSPFCLCDKRGGCASASKNASTFLGVELITKVRGIEYIKMVENAKFGYGKGINPCIDCRLFYLQEAKQVMDEIGASFLVTGEVLGQRPMSQRRDAIAIIDRECGFSDIILRPLSAHHFKPTKPERDGIVDRTKLLAINGRSRKTQLSMSSSFGYKDYPCPSGGCLLTEPLFARKLNDLFLNKKNYTMSDIHLLKFGRHFRISKNLKIIVGKNEDENNRLLRYSSLDNFTAFYTDDFPSPALLCDGVDDGVNKIAASFIVEFSKNKPEALNLKSKQDGKEEFCSISEFFDGEWIRSKNIVETYLTR